MYLEWLPKLHNNKSTLKCKFNPQKTDKDKKGFYIFFYTGKESVDSDSIMIVHENLGQQDSLQVILSFHICKTSL